MLENLYTDVKKKNSNLKSILKLVDEIVVRVKVRLDKQAKINRSIGWTPAQLPTTVVIKSYFFVQKRRRFCERR